MKPELLASVIVPVYNGSGVIERCLNALCGQAISPDQYEVIVVDDGSTDDTAARWKLGPRSTRTTL